MDKIYKFKPILPLFLLFILALHASRISAQTYNDGPIQLQIKVRDINTTFAETDLAVFGVVGTPDDLRYFLWARDNADVDGVGWQGGLCNQQSFSPPGPSMDFNQTLFNYTYPGATVPQYFDLKIDCWEDESPDQLLGIGCGGTSCVYDMNFCCGGMIWIPWPISQWVCAGAWDDDDYRCNADPFKVNMDYRLGPPCQWYNHGYVVGSGCGGNNYYQPRIETYWKYTNGIGCGSAIALGNVQPGFTPLSHYNSNECYPNTYPGSPGNDVYYAINVTQPTGVRATLCAAASFDTYLYVLDPSCNIVPIGSNDNFCGNTSQVDIPLCNPGTYYIVVDGANAGAMGTFTLTVQENPSLLPTADAGSDQLICIGTATPIGGSPTATGGAGGFTYSWSNGATLNAANIANPIAFPTATTTYTVTITDANNCTTTDQVTVQVAPGPAINLGPDQTVCPNTAVNLNAGAGFLAYFWSNGATVDNITVTQPGQYFVAAIDLFGCMGRDTVVINNFPSPGLFLGNDTSICANANITFDAQNAGATYAWNTGANTQTITVNTAGQYDVTITDANACTTADTINLAVDPLPIPNLGPDVTVCAGTDAQLNAGTGYVAYAWSNGGTNQIEFVNAVGTYTVTVTDANGCQGNDAIDVLNNPLPTPAITGTLSFCSGQSTTLDAGAGFSAYAWSTGDNTQTITVSAGGNYFVTVTDANGCEGNTSVTVTENALPSVNLGADQVVCNGATTTLDAGPGFTTYAWSSGGLAQTETAASTGTYTVTVTDANGCQGTDDVDVVVNSVVLVNLGPDMTICDSGMVMLNAGAGLTSYLWNDGSVNQWLFVNSAGTYSVTVTDPFGCTGTDQINISTSSVITGTFLGSDTTLCLGETLLLDAGANYADYLWGNGSQDQYLLVSAAGIYTVEVTDTSGCRMTDDITITIDSFPPLQLGPDQNICPGETATLDAGAGFTSYLWSTGATTQTIAVSAVGNFTVSVKYNNCEQTDDINVGDQCAGSIFIPNVFSPNGDGINDQFEIKGAQLSQFHLWVFDRWGKMQFESQMVSDMWDGKFKGKSVPEGVYYFHLEYKISGNETQFQDNGNITLIR